MPPTPADPSEQVREAATARPAGSAAPPGASGTRTHHTMTEERLMAESPDPELDLAAELEFVKSLALEAAEVALARCRQVTPHEKDNLSDVTDLDQDLERLIRGRLRARFPDDALTGEE
jgi:fructose-1,6-bisphosphatase/inositol monophosphatase family enzyme